MSSTTRLCLISALALCSVFAIRAFTLGAMPLIDPSEARYALVAKMMTESGQFLVPQLINHQGISEPFWGKPPLFFWLVALSYRLLGEGEAASRIPSFFAMMVTVFAVFSAAKKIYGSSIAWTSSLLLLTSGLFFVYGGLCQVDMLMTACLASAYTSFIYWHSSREHRKDLYAIIFALAVGAGFLTKGPVIIALLGLGLLPWYLLCKRKKFVLEPFPWLSTGLLALSVIIPWYVLAEKASPGIVKYFFFNENFLRFFVKSYGDKYGFAHRYTFGTIWLFALVGTLPWGLFALVPGFWRQLRFRAETDVWQSLLLFWAISPAVLFTFSHHILLSYVIPGIPGMCIALAVVLHRYGQERLPAFLSSATVPTGLILLGVAFTSVGLLFSRLGNTVLPIYDLELVQALFGLVALIGLLSILKAHWNPRGVLAIIVGLALFIVSSSAAIIAASAIPAAAFQPYINERFPASKYELNFPFGIPYSAYVYLPHEMESAPEEIGLPDEEDDDMKEAMLVPDFRVAEFKLALSHSDQPFRFVTDLGTWKVWERCTPEESDNLKKK